MGRGIVVLIVIGITFSFSCLHYIVSEGVPVEERIDQATERCGFGGMRSRPPQTAQTPENHHAVLNYFRS